MTISHPEHAGKSAPHENKRPSDEEKEAGDTPSKSDQMKTKLKAAGHYALLGIGPLVAIIAVVVAVLALNGNHASREELAQTSAKLEEMTTSLAGIKNDIDKLKLASMKDKSMANEELSKHSEQLDALIRNLTPIQTKLKISPTVEEQLRPHVSEPVVAPASATVAASAHNAEAVRSSSATQKTEPAPKKSVEPSGDVKEKKLSPQVKAMKDAIDQYNRK